MTGRVVALALALSAVGLWSGCRTCPARAVALETLAAEYNANAAKVHRLWANARVRLTLKDEQGRSFTWGSTSPLAPYNAQLRLWKEATGPPGFVLVGRELTELFRVGIDAVNGVYYVWYHLGRTGQAWFGRTELAGAPGVRGVPIDPLQLVEVLGLTSLPAEPGKLPAVVMTLRKNPCAYVVRYIRAQPITGRLKIWREVYFRWDDRLPRRPYHIRLFDPSGRCRVLADVGDYQPIEWDGPPEAAPVMPTDYHVRWPAIEGVQPAAELHMRLSGMSTRRRFMKAFLEFRSHLPPGIEPVQLDADLPAVPKEGRSKP